MHENRGCGRGGDRRISRRPPPLAGEEITFVARGRNLAAIRAVVQDVMDAEGYVTIKELINRGGEKISGVRWTKG